MSSLFPTRTLPAGPMSAMVGKDWLLKESGCLWVLSPGSPGLCLAIPSETVTNNMGQG